MSAVDPSRLDAARDRLRGQRPPSGGEPWLTVIQLAEQLHVSERTVRRMVREGAPSIVFARRSRRFRLSQVERWAAAAAGGENVRPLTRGESEIP